MIIVGIDEVGRGCWAGPLVAGAVVLKNPIDGLKDSKKLSKRERERLAAVVQEQAEAVGLGWVWPEVIDTIGLSASVKTAMAEALNAIKCDYDEIIIDGNINYLPETGKSRPIIKADDLYPCVSAASIVAKVARDKYMSEKAALEYPDYGFEFHVGYGTAGHIAALRQNGPTAIHRMSYKPIKNLVLESNT